MPRTVEINWGDGTPVETWTGDKGSKDHKFAQPGNYQVTVTPTDGGAPRTVGVAVPCGGGGAVTGTVTCDRYGDPSGRTVNLAIAGATGPVSVNWGDGGYPETITGTAATHTYSPNVTGPQTITMTNAGTPVAVTGSPITVPCATQLRAAAVPPVCVRPLVTGVQVTGRQVVANVSHPEGVRDTVVVIYRNGLSIAQSLPIGQGGSGTTAPIGPLTPGTYVAKACEVDSGSGAASACCEAGTGTAFTISAR